MHVEAAYVSLGVEFRPRSPAGAVCGAYHDDIVHHERRGRQPDIRVGKSVIFAIAHANVEIYEAVITKIGVGNAGFSVQ